MDDQTIRILWTTKTITAFETIQRPRRSRPGYTTSHCNKNNSIYCNVCLGIVPPDPSGGWRLCPKCNIFAWLGNCACLTKRIVVERVFYYPHEKIEKKTPLCDMPSVLFKKCGIGGKKKNAKNGKNARSAVFIVCFFFFSFSAHRVDECPQIHRH